MCRKVDRTPQTSGSKKRGENEVPRRGQHPGSLLLHCVEIIHVHKGAAVTTTETASTPPPPADAARSTSAPPGRRTNWFGAFWRWHFYGAVIVIPVLFALSVSGMTYMFRAQVDAWTHPGVLTVTVPTEADRLPLSDQESAVRAAFPDREVLSVTDNSGDRATVFVTEDATESRNVYVDPYTAAITGDLHLDDLVSTWAERVHGDLLLGDGEVGDRIVELGASWAIVLTITGFILFFTGRRPRSIAVRKKVKGSRLRQAHAIVGLPVGLGILMLVVSGLPWTGVWGNLASSIASGSSDSLWGDDPGAESTVKEQIEASNGSSSPAGWEIADLPTANSTGSGTPISIDSATAAARAEGAPEPYFVTYPEGVTGVYSVYGYQWANNGNPAESDVSLQKTVHVDQYSGDALEVYSYDDLSLLSKTVANGIAIHEGRRFGPINMLLTTLFCLAVIFMCVSAPMMWWSRRGNASGLAAPRARLPIVANRILLVAVVALGFFLPLFGLSVLVILAIDHFLIRRIPAARKYFGSV
nr:MULTISPECIES: PepSY domain-containing protein [unclassified Microbacterium]